MNNNYSDILSVCRGCVNYHGRVYGGNFLVCAIHPLGYDGKDCPDYESSHSTNQTKESEPTALIEPTSIDEAATTPAVPDRDEIERRIKEYRAGVRHLNLFVGINSLIATVAGWLFTDSGAVFVSNSCCYWYGNYCFGRSQAGATC